MATPGPVIRHISDTALWTAAIRADESDRPDALFHDPCARRLAGEHGFEILHAIKRPAVRTAVTLRTVAIDQVVLASVRKRACDTVLNLAAGLDARAWRLDLPSDLRWIDVDLPDLLDYKDPLLAGQTPRCRHEEVRLDLRDRDARLRLFGRVAGESPRVLVLSEGLLAYLPPEAVAELADDLHAQQAFVEWVFELTGWQIPDRIKNAADEQRSADARTLFAPAEGTAFFAPHGWTEAEYVDLFMEAPRLGRDSLLGRVLRGLMPILPRKARESMERGLGVVRLERAV